MKDRIGEMKERELRQRELRRVKKENARLEAQNKALRRTLGRPEISSSQPQPHSGRNSGDKNLRARMRLHDLLFRR
jgi:hypothetical protein